MPVSQWTSIAREGATTDGRVIEGSWLEQAAKNFNAKEYGARVNIEHIRGFSPNSDFRAYGDVVELKTEERDGKLHLLAKIDATDDLVELQKKRQKIYTSIEIDPSFSDTKEAYLVGLAMTDSPASLGTEIMQFAAQAKVNPFSARKQRPENLFTAAEEIVLEFSDETNEPETGTQPEGPSLLEKVKALFSKHKTESKEEFSEFKTELEATLSVIAEKVAEPKEESEAFAQLKAAHEELKNQFAELRNLLDEQPSTQTFNRQPATGGAQVEANY